MLDRYLKYKINSWCDFFCFGLRSLRVCLLGRNHTPLSRAGKPAAAAASAGGQPQRGDREDDGIRDIVVKQECIQPYFF